MLKKIDNTKYLQIVAIANEIKRLEALYQEKYHLRDNAVLSVLWNEIMGLYGDFGDIQKNNNDINLFLSNLFIYDNIVFAKDLLYCSKNYLQTMDLNTVKDLFKEKNGRLSFEWNQIIYNLALMYNLKTNEDFDKLENKIDEVLLYNDAFSEEDKKNLDDYKEFLSSKDFTSTKKLKEFAIHLPF